MHERRERGVKVKEILKDKIEKQNKNKSRRGEHLSFYDYQRLMMHDCFRRVRGAIKRVR
ncbi:hypothetical protein GTH52_07155 [Clostridium tyrobutyricum]|uniref:Uncharacterized protein n=1 Tax=Clostridium tyrobutyricum DIVETGP TaxID=1408889 RepID=W6N5D4_CLOTY|nr:hypothetical protein [Clostridium tyrobutyricum]MBV4435426.1 hypothetical protein [Clostridium tyrobutyricum]QNB66680.1 hypothetical protein GTH52_07155 [Clostridium tyrobutyricum]CDL91496.1 hypothetical protein CTDIVETGP_1566 [Clostridium tyrobutyricum DIVETGP]